MSELTLPKRYHFLPVDWVGQERVDVLINNAGVMAIPGREVAEDGFERQFATNYLGPFALTGLMMPALDLWS